MLFKSKASISIIRSKSKELLIVDIRNEKQRLKIGYRCRNANRNFYFIFYWDSRASPASRDRGGKIQIRGANFLPKCEGFFWPKSQIFRPKASKKKKVFAEIRRLFLAEIANSNVFSAQKHQLKKIPWGARKKSGGIAPLPPRWRRACWDYIIFAVLIIKWNLLKKKLQVHKKIHF